MSVSEVKKNDKVEYVVTNPGLSVEFFYRDVKHETSRDIESTKEIARLPTDVSFEIEGLYANKEEIKEKLLPIKKSLEKKANSIGEAIKALS